MARKKKTKKVPRNGYARAAARRHGGPMKHRLAPRGGARNNHREYEKENDDGRQTHDK